MTSYCSAKWVHIRVASNGRNRGAVVGICGNFRVIIIMVTVECCSFIRYIWECRVGSCHEEIARILGIIAFRKYRYHYYLICLDVKI